MLKLSPTTCLIVCCLGLAVPPALHAQAPMQQLGSAEPAAPAPAPVPDSSTPQQDEATASAGEGTDRAALPPNRAELAARQGRAFIAHVPRGSAPLDDVRLKLDVRGADLAGEIRVYYRPLIEPSALARHVVVQRDASGYSAQIPSHEVSAPGLSYWIVERMPDGSERAVFASSADPAPLHVELPAIESRERRLLSENGGRRSAATLRGEWVDLGGFKVRPENAASRQRDSYYLLEAQYAYSYFRIVDELEFAFGHLRGDILDQDTLDRRDKVGLDYGRSALTLALGDWFRVRAGVLL
ncbi:MAG: hypothetical protein JWN48_2787, partial [Myxococcaceae bacterium]|nr:hypothetical protein [Myxococcaceae bacterium]